MLGGIILILIILYAIGSIMEGYQNDEKRIYRKVKDRLQLYKNMFNSFTKRFLKCGYPYTDYLLALGMAQNKGFSTNLTQEQINFYLSYPKKYEFKNVPGVKDKYYLYVNGINLGPAEKCWLVNWKQFNEDSDNNPRYDKVYVDNGCKTFYIDKYIIDTDFSCFGNEYKLQKDVKSGTNFQDNLVYKAFENIENESNEALKDCSTLITSELNTFIDKLQEKNYSIKELEELYEENNKKWRDDYFEKYTDISKDEFYKDYEHPNIFYKIYEDDGNYLNTLYNPTGAGSISFHKSTSQNDWYAGQEAIKIRNSHRTEKTDEIDNKMKECLQNNEMETYRILADEKESSFTELTEEEKQIKNNNEILGNLSVNRVKNVYWENKYANAIKDIELKYDLKDYEPDLINLDFNVPDTDFRKVKYKNKIARKAIVDYVLYNPILQKAKFVYKDGTSFNLNKPN